MLARTVTIDNCEFGIDTGDVFVDLAKGKRWEPRLSFSMEQLQRASPTTLQKIVSWFIDNGQEFYWLMSTMQFLDTGSNQCSPADALRVIESHLASEEDKEIARGYLLDRNESRHRKPKPTREQPGTVYVLAADDGSGRYKIGRTTQLGTRTRHFETKLPFEVSLRCSFECEDAGSTERMLHERFSEQRINGEWFYLSEEDVRGIEAEFRTEVG